MKKIEKKDPLPLIPKSNVQPCSDISHVIREVFQDTLEEEIEELYSVQCEERNCAGDFEIMEYVSMLKETYKEHQILMADITQIEGKLMDAQANLLIQNDFIQHNNPVWERMKLRRIPSLLKLGKDAVEKYNIIEMKDLAPPLHEQALDFRFQEMEKLENVFDKNEDCFINKILKKSVPTFSPLLPANLQEEPQKTTQDKGEVTHTLQKKMRKSLKKHPTIFVAEPNHVKFTNYNIGVKYKKYIILKNVSNIVGKFDIQPLSEHSKFCIYWDPLPGHTKMVAPGMSLRITVEFCTDSLEDVKEQLTILVHKGKRIFVYLIAYKEPPQLRVTELQYAEDCQVTSLQKILCTTIDCGECFLGDIQRIIITVHNNGGGARFWLLSEQDWYSATVKDVTWNNVILLPPFMVTPAYFSLNKGDAIDIDVKFLPLKLGFHVEKLYVICDNCSYRELELIGDGLCYEDFFITIQDIPKIFPVDVDDDERAEYYLDLGKSLRSGIIKMSFSVSNSSGIEMVYTWKKRKAEIKCLTPFEEFFDLSDSELFIVPDIGNFHPYSTVTFTVYCLIENAEIGRYRHILQLYLHDLPLESLTEQCHPLEIIPTEEVMSERNSFDILIGEIEVWAEVIPILITLDPCIIIITGNKLRCDNTTTSRNITVYNKSEFMLTCEWVNEADFDDPAIVPSCYINIIPSYFHISPCSCFDCTLKIVFATPGRTVGRFRCVINKGAKILELAVVVDIDDPIISLSTHLLNFGLVKRGTLIKAPLVINNSCVIETIWRIQEYGYNMSVGELYRIEQCNLSGDAGFLPPDVGSHSIQYRLNTRKPQVWCSLLVLSTTNAEHQAFVLVLADIKLPNLCIKAPPAFNAILNPNRPLYVGKRVQCTITLQNLTYFPTSFMWGEPTGYDAHRLKLHFHPHSGVILGTAKLEVTIHITPLERGCIKHCYVPCFIGRVQCPIILSIETQIEDFSVSFLFPISKYNKEDEYGLMFSISWPPEGEIQDKQFTRQSVIQVSEPTYTYSVPIPRPTINLTSQDIFMAGFSTTFPMSDSNKVSKKLKQGTQKKGDKYEHDSKWKDFKESAETVGIEDTIIMSVKSPFHFKAKNVDKVLITSQFEMQDETRIIHVPGFDDIPPIDFPLSHSLNLFISSQKEEEDEKETEIRTFLFKQNSKESSTILPIEQDRSEKPIKSDKQEEQVGKKMLQNPSPVSTEQVSEVTTPFVDYLENKHENKRKENKRQEKDQITESKNDSASKESERQKGKGRLIQLLNIKKAEEIRETESSQVSESDVQECKKKEETEFLKILSREENSEEKDNLHVNEPEILFTDYDPMSKIELQKSESTSTSSTISLQISNDIDIEWPATIYFTDLPCHQAFKKTFVLRNETPLQSKFTANVLNFSERENTTKPSMIKQIQMKIAGIQEDVWKYRISDKAEIVFVIEPSSGILGPNETVPIDVWVYANTWGTYSDYVICHVVGLPPFHIQLKAEVIGFPLSFPMNDGGRNNETVLRFGVLGPKGPPQIRRVRIRNDSCVRINVHWHLFIKDEYNPAHLPFNILLDIFSSTQETPKVEADNINGHSKEKNCMTLSLAPYYGKEDFTIFQINPRDITIPANGEALFLVKANPIMLNEDKSKHVKALAVGNIQLSPINRGRSGLLSRPSGVDMDPVKLELEATIETSLISLHLIRGSLIFNVTAPEIMNAPDEIYMISRSLVFLNERQAPLKAEVKTNIPFEVVKIRTLDTEGSHLFSNKYMVLNPGKIVEIELKCTLNKRYIDKALLTFKQKAHVGDNMKVVSKGTVSMYRDLLFVQHSQIKQNVQLRINIAFPSLSLSTDTIDFGPVYVQNTKQMILKMTNTAGYDFWLKIWKKNDSEEFTVLTPNILLPAMTVGRLAATELAVLFKPSDTKEYQDKLMLQTCIPGKFLEVTVLGMGSIDEKYDMLGF